MINRVILVGRLTADIELRKSTSGKSVSQFTLAVPRIVAKDSNSPKADFISCVAWNQGAEILKKYTHKGSQIGVEGRIQTRNYDDPNIPGKKVYVTEVVCDSITLLDSKSSDNKSNQFESDDLVQTLTIDSDDLPF